ncbi:MAG: cytochrome bc1 complex diheme cytochrome c subunit [Acidimicrobiales bacterium]
MARRTRQMALPALLVMGVAAVSIVLFGSTARAESTGSRTAAVQPAAPATTVPAGTNSHALGNTGGTSYQDTGLGKGTATGRQLFIQACSSCHGTDAQGSARAPTLVGLGSAAVDFWVITGRMPLEVPTEQAMRKNPIFSVAQAKEIADYVASLQVPGYVGRVPQGPSIPGSINLSKANLAKGGELFRLNCSTCHSLTASGGALSYGAFAPSLSPDTPLEIAEAIRTGPGNMPRFSVAQLSSQNEADIIKYVKYITHPQDRGGFNLGHVGPTTEGFVGIVFGVGLLMLAAFWIGDRA